MQSTEAAAGKQSRGDEESINFRPSPNFKHMKKYLKSKFEEMNNSKAEPEAETEKAVASEPEVEPEKPAPVVEEKPKASTSSQPPPPPPPPTVVQPPLPPNPPPPDLPPVSEIKQEIIDEEYGQYIDPKSIEPGTESMQDYDTDLPEQEALLKLKQNSTGPTMCRNFVRGTCKKGDSCIFVHELILSQLEGVYTFCRNFQNRQCTFAKCKFVHATVFEKENFYRTGYLPPHTMAHLPPNTLTQMKNVPPPPPPPPPEEPAGPYEGDSLKKFTGPADAPQTYYTMPNLEVNASTMSVADLNCATVPTYIDQALIPPVHDIYVPAAPAPASDPASPSKKAWAEVMGEEDNFNPELAEPPTKRKCPTCDATDFRIQYCKNKLENLISANEELNEKSAILNVKTERLCTALLTMFKSENPSPGLPGLTSALGGKEKAILEQLNMLASTNRAVSQNSEEESIKNLLGSNVNLQTILTKLLMVGNDQAGPQ